MSMRYKIYHSASRICFVLSGIMLLLCLNLAYGTYAQYGLAGGLFGAFLMPLVMSWAVLSLPFLLLGLTLRQNAQRSAPPAVADAYEKLRDKTRTQEQHLPLEVPE